MEIKIYGKDIELTQEIKDYANEKIGSIEKFLENIINIDVDLIRTTQHHKQGQIFKASVNINVPGNPIHGEFSAETVFAAIDGLVDEITREAKKMKGKKKTKQMKGLRKLKKIMTSFLSRDKFKEEDETIED